MMKKVKLCLGMFFIFILAFAGVQSCVFAEEYDGYIVKFSSPPIMPMSENGVMEAVVAEQNLFKVNTEDAEYLAYLQNSTEVEFIEPDYVVSIPDNEIAAEERNILAEEGEHLVSSNVRFAAESAAAGFDIPNDFRYGSQWNMPMINAPYLWKNGISTHSVKIGVIDSGNPSRHPDVNINIAEGRDYTGIGSVYDIFGHSTFICGILASEINNYIGTAGILNDCTVVPLRILSDSNKTNTSVLYRALYDAIYEYECDVINLSLSFDVPILSVENLINEALSRGIILVSAVGNSGNSTMLYPAGYDGVIGVGSVTRNKTRYFSSQKNESVDVAAPGANLYSTYLKRSKSGNTTFLNYLYDTGTGTSYATPHVSAAAAVAKAYNPSITSDGFLEVLAKTSEHLGSEGKNTEYGYGLVDIQKIAEEMQNNKELITPPNGEISELSAAAADEPPIFIGSFEPCLRFDGGLEVNGISANVTVKNNLQNTDIMIAMALYDENESEVENKNEAECEDRLCGLSSINGESYVGSSGSTFNLDFIDIPQDCKNPYVKVFVWDENFSPLVDVFTYRIEQ